MGSTGTIERENKNKCGKTFYLFCTYLNARRTTYGCGWHILLFSSIINYSFFSVHAFQLFIVVICRIEASMEGIGDDSMMSRIGSTFIHDWWMCSCESMQDRRHHTHECTSYIYNERMFIVYVESIRFFIVRAITLYRREDIEWKVTCDNLCFFICYFLIHFLYLLLLRLPLTTEI